MSLSEQPGRPLSVVRPPVGADYVLRCTNLTASYARIQVVFDATFNVQPSECLVLLGPNGAGKTSLLGAIAGLVRNTGNVFLDKTCHSACNIDPLSRGIGVQN